MDMRKTTFLGALLGALAFSGVAAAQQVVVTEPVPATERNVGVGLVAGTGLAVTARWWLGPDTSVDTRLGIDGLGEGLLSLSADYQYDLLDIIPSGAAVHMPVYVGIGAQVGIDVSPNDGAFDGDDFGLGARVPVGIRAEFERVPVDIFAEFVPRLMLIEPGIGGPAFDLSAGIGARFFF
jgi:hypothetical protein